MLDSVFAPTFAITYDCNMYRYCQYCYAKDFSLNNPGRNNMSIEDFRKIVKLFINYGVKEIVLVGGEPTVHKDFYLFLDYIKESGLKARMFTNGFYSKEKSDIICSNRRLKVLFFHYDDHYFDSRGKKFEYIYMNNLAQAKASGKDIYLRCNFDLPDFQFKKLVSLASRLDTKIAYSFTTPAPGDVPYTKLTQYARYLPQYRKFTETAKKRGLRLFLARPLPLCMFRDQKDINFFKKYADLHSTCVAIKDLTINPDTSMQLCLVTFALQKGPIGGMRELLSKMDYFKKLEKRLHRFPPTRECSECKYFWRQCQGGCFSFHIYSQEVPRHFKC